MATGPNPFNAAWNMLSARRLRAPNPNGANVVDHTPLADVLNDLRIRGMRTLPESLPTLAAYKDGLSGLDPDELARRESLAFWINLYNAGALHRAGEAFSADHDTVLRIPGVFSTPWATVAGETMSLDDIEHGKIRRFRDPRIHGALVCGSVSCPTLRSEPFTGTSLDEQLDDQMRSFLAGGAARLDRLSNTLHLTRVLKWYGGDFVRPRRMPTLRPARPSETAKAISAWLEHGDAVYIKEREPSVEFASYDWSLGCSLV